MSQVISAIARHARHRPHAIAFDTAAADIDYRTLSASIAMLSARLAARRIRTLGVLAGNGVAWALADLAGLAAGLCVVPVPLFFSPQQMRHALGSAGVDAVLAEPGLPLPWTATTSPECLEIGGVGIELHRLSQPTVVLPQGTRKITYTSGTTGTPKGVCLDANVMETVAQSLCDASAASADDRHLCVLPLATLLENLGGLYAPLLAGATVCMRPAAQVGLRGASGFDPQPCLALLDETSATTVILVPQLLQALVQAIAAGRPRPPHLRFVAVGGAPVSPRLLSSATDLGLPVFEGYGLSECASVVALNAPTACRPGSVGRPLPQLRVRVAGDGEIHVSGRGFLGYVGEPPRAPDQEIATGDLGRVDADGFLHLTGRRKNLFITAFGRNVAPEWIESELALQPAIAQAAVFGEARPWNVAVIVPRPGADAHAVDRAIETCNQELPDYARVRRWLAATAPFTPENEQATANGRLRRDRIRQHYHARIEGLYEEENRDVVL